MFSKKAFQLPQGASEFEDLAKTVISKSGLPDNDSVRFALAAAILHFPQPKAELTEDYFVQIMKRGAANQVAAQVLQDLKEKQKAEEAKKAEPQPAAPVEATTPAPQVEATNVPQQATAPAQAGQ